MTINTVLPIPNIFSAKPILCVQPHYDDNDIGPGGYWLYSKKPEPKFSI